MLFRSLFHHNPGSMFEINYNFKFTKDFQKSFKIHINDDLEVNGFETSNPPDWALFENFRCQICKLDRNEHKHCPIAVNLNKIIPFFTDFPSYEKVTLTVETPQRSYQKKTTIQEALGSMAGILMAGSKCPVMSKLKPMVKFHLPFAGIEETGYRVLSMYLTAQYVKKSKGQEPDWELNGLNQLYKEIQIVNSSIAHLLSSLEEKDTGKNAVVMLNNFASFLTLRLEDKHFYEFEQLFKDHLKNPS